MTFGAPSMEQVPSQGEQLDPVKAALVEEARRRFEVNLMKPQEMMLKIASLHRGQDRANQLALLELWNKFQEPSEAN